LDVQGVLRKMIKDAFDREGIEIPISQHVLSFKHQDDRDLISKRLGSRRSNPTDLNHTAVKGDIKAGSTQDAS
ncbi:MAG: hypothetical protein F6K09_23715, partial [Merismopedia sp. SIO2A8]|nr:hypothetical protein [Merismopedia sp. SIO2A8]